MEGRDSEDRCSCHPSPATVSVSAESWSDRVEGGTRVVSRDLKGPWRGVRLITYYGPCTLPPKPLTGPSTSGTGRRWGIGDLGRDGSSVRS